MTIADARAMVAQLFWYAPRSRQLAIARHMVAADTNALHAAWFLFGRARGLPCRCTPCETEPAAGSEVVMRVLVQGRAPDDEAVQCRS